MKKFAFISNAEPTNNQKDVARGLNIELFHVDNAPKTTLEIVAAMGNPDPGAINFGEVFDGIVTNCPITALRFSQAGFPVGVFDSDKSIVIISPIQPISKAKRQLYCTIMDEIAIASDISSEFSAN